MGVIGVKFGDYHSYDDWKLKLKEIEIGSPGAKLVEIDVMGMDGVLDLTEAVTGSVRYGKRTLRFVFDARNCGYRKWADLISEISNKIHGKKVRIVLDCDNEYYYEGRCTVDTSKINDITSEFVITCECYPYKTAVASENGDWLWDPFSFVDGVITRPEDVVLNNQTKTVTLPTDPARQKVTLWLNSGLSGSVWVRTNREDPSTRHLLRLGRNRFPEVRMMPDAETTLYLTGTGSVGVDYRRGSL